MATLASYEDTQVVPKLELRECGEHPRVRPVTNSFAAPRPATRWPWIVAAIVWVAAAATPIDPTHGKRLSAEAEQLLQTLPR